MKSWRSGKRFVAGAYYCTCPKLVPSHVHDYCVDPITSQIRALRVPEARPKDGKVGTDGTIEDEAHALFGIEARFYID